MTSRDNPLLNALEANAAAHLRGYPLARRTTAQHLIDAVERIREQNTAIAELTDAIGSVIDATDNSSGHPISDEMTQAVIKCLNAFARHKAGK